MRRGMWVVEAQPQISSQIRIVPGSYIKQAPFKIWFFTLLDDRLSLHISKFVVNWVLTS